MTPSALLFALRARGVELTPEGDRLRYRAPTGTLTPDLRKQLVSHKAGLLRVLREELLAELPCTGCGDPIALGETIVCYGGPHHEACAPHGEATAS